MFVLVAGAFGGLWAVGAIRLQLPRPHRNQQANVADPVAGATADTQGEGEKEEVPPHTEDGKKGPASPEERTPEQVLRQAEIARRLAELDRQAKADIAEIDQRIAWYKRQAANWEWRVAALKQHPRFGDPFNPAMTAAINALTREGADLEADLRSISRLIAEKQSAFNHKRETIISLFPDATPPGWGYYYGESR
jgi:hypothetical protein